MSYLVFDIETVPDLSVWTPPAPEAAPANPAPPPGQGTLALVPVVPTDGGIVIPPIGTTAGKKSRSRKKPVDPNAPPKDVFPPLYAHRVIAIGYVWLDENFTVKQIGCVGTRAFGDDEAKLLTGWDSFVNQERPTVVTFAGRGFEIPVLGLRALRHGVAQGWADNDYRYRYGDRHLDLFDLFTEHGLVPRTGYSLDMFSQLIGLPGKNGVDGSKVNALFMRGEIATIEGYCACDAVRETFLLLRYLLMRGRLTREQYQAAAKTLLELSAAQQLGGITFGVDLKRLLLEG